MSNNGFSVAVWGPCTWIMLHTISFNYPIKPTAEQKKDYYDFIISLTKVLPCKACRENLTRNLKELKFNKNVMRSRETFSRFIYDLHSHINKNLKKPNNLTYEDIRDKYESFRAACAVSDKDHKGCIKPIEGGVKSKSVIRIVPAETRAASLTIDPRCRRKHPKK